jgi:hypothetical protein
MRPCRGLVSSQTDHGQTVHEMWVNFQDPTKIGGAGYLRLLEFLPDGQTVHAKTYSPLLDRYLVSGRKLLFFGARQ